MTNIQYQMSNKKNYDIHERIFEFIVKETVFWTRIIERVNDIPFRKEALELIQEGNEIIAIVSTIIKKTAVSKRI